MSSELYVLLNYPQSSSTSKGFFASDTKLGYFDSFPPLDENFLLKLHVFILLV